MQSFAPGDLIQHFRQYICDYVSWNFLDALCQARRINTTTAPHQIASPQASVPTSEPMALGPTESPLLTKLNQPITFFALACISISVLALSTAWSNNRKSSSTARPQLKRNEPVLSEPEIIIAPDEGYSSSGERAPEEVKGQTASIPNHAALLARTSSTLASCSALLQKTNSINVTEEEQAIAMSSLSAELPMSIAALCQIQQLLGIYYDVFSNQPGLRSCYETVLTGLAFVVSTLDGELATLSDCDCSVRKFPSSSSYRQFEELIDQLREHRQSLMFVAESAQRSTKSSSGSSSLTVAPVDSKARTPGSDLKGFMDSPPDFDELPEYSPPAGEHHPIAPYAKLPPTHAVEIDSHPIHMNPNTNTAVTAGDIFAALSDNSLSELKSLLSTGFDPNTPYGKLQRTGLHEAARLNRTECAKTLVQSGAVIDIDDSKGDTPLHLASWEGHVEITSTLIAAGADIDRLSGRDGYSALWCAITGHHIDLARLLLRHGARISLRSPSDGLPLHQAAITGQSAMCQLLLDRGAIVDCTDKEENTPLHYAATIGDIRTAKILINEGADLNAKQERGLTPLHWACHKGHDEMVKLLLDSGAKINARSKTFATPLHCAAARGHLGCAKLLVRKGIDCKTVTTGWDGATGTAEEVAVLKGFASLAAFIEDFKGKKR
jgi:ankyrin repeat protein